MSTNNSTNNVAVGKPMINGAVFRAPAGATLPTDATTDLASVYINMGYISEDGVVNSKARETNEIKAWGGDVVANPQTSKKDTFKLKFIESKNVEVLKAAHGDNNVSGTLDDGVTIRENSEELEKSVWVIETILGDTLKRIVIPEGKPTEIGDVEYKDDTPVGYELTITAYPHAGYDGDTHREFMKTSPDGATGATA